MSCGIKNEYDYKVRVMCDLFIKSVVHLSVHNYITYANMINNSFDLFYTHHLQHVPLNPSQGCVKNNLINKVIPPRSLAGDCMI